MHHHAIFGGHLASDLPFPELPTLEPAEPNWILSLDTSLPGERTAALIGEVVVDGVPIRLWSDEAGCRLEFGDTGAFDISADGRSIRWHAPAEANLVLARADVITRVLVVSLHLAGKLCLHGSAVSVAGAGIAFVAPKGFGKSSLAIALIRAGACLITDDTLAVDARSGLACPGIHHVRMWKDASDSLGAQHLPGRLGQYGQKGVLTDLPDHLLMQSPVPLSAIYNLRPVEPGNHGPAASRTRLPPIAAAFTALQHARMGMLLGGAEAARVFERAAAVARTVPVYDLTVVRGWARLPAVVERLAQWHDFDPTPLLHSGSHA